MESGNLLKMVARLHRVMQLPLRLCLAMQKDSELYQPMRSKLAIQPKESEAESRRCASIADAYNPQGCPRPAPLPNDLCVGFATDSPPAKATNQYSRRIFVPLSYND